MVYGGKKLRSELFGSSFASRQIKTWKQAGLAIEVLDDRVDSEAVKIQKSGQVESNDAHIIALAVVSGARTLYSRDEVLHEDFKNPRLIDNPRGKVYQSAAKHIKLLEHTISCRRD